MMMMMMMMNMMTMMIITCFLHPKGSHTQFALGGRELIHFNYDDDNGDGGDDDDDDDDDDDNDDDFFFKDCKIKIVEAPLEW